MPRVILFDIDNTLLYTGGAGSHAMNVAFRELYGIENGFSGIEFSGRTDRYIFARGLLNHGIEGDVADHLADFTALYYEILPDSLIEREGRLMPGFPELLQALARGGSLLGLATGNFSQAARIKLRHYRLDEHFAGGGFGEVSLDRADVVREAIRNVGATAARSDILVVGDTPHDITSALENGVLAVGVATGNYSVEDLDTSGAHLAFADFADFEAAAASLLGDL